jgi:hypothetical protein
MGPSRRRRGNVRLALGFLAALEACGAARAASLADASGPVVAASQATSSPVVPAIRPEERLVWSFGPPHVIRGWRKDVYLPAGNRACDLASVSWLDASGRVAWTSPVPARMASPDSVECVSCERNPGGPEPCVDKTAERAWPSNVDEPLLVDGAVAIADGTGLWVLDLATGQPRLDWTDPAPANAAGYWADTAEYRLEGVTGCAGYAPGGLPFVRCDDKLVWFDGRTAVVVDTSSWKVLATGAFSAPAAPTVCGKSDTWSTRIPVGPWVLAIDGTIYNR